MNDSLLARFATERGLDRFALAIACGVQSETARTWWRGAPVPERHAGALGSLLGREETRALYRSFPLSLGSGRRAADGGRLTLVRAARVLRGHGEHELAARVAARAEAIGEAGR